MSYDPVRGARGQVTGKPGEDWIAGGQKRTAAISATAMEAVFVLPFDNPVFVHADDTINGGEKTNSKSFPRVEGVPPARRLFRRAGRCRRGVDRHQPLPKGQVPLANQPLHCIRRQLIA